MCCAVEFAVDQSQGMGSYSRSPQGSVVGSMYTCVAKETGTQGAAHDLVNDQSQGACTCMPHLSPLVARPNKSIDEQTDNAIGLYNHPRVLSCIFSDE